MGAVTAKCWRKEVVMAGSGILVLVTGGTIDKTYFDGVSDYKYDDSIIGDLLKTARANCSFRIRELMLKDSLELDAADRDVIADAIDAAIESKIVITHGTDTMVQTAVDLEARALGKTIVLAGAFMPARFASSDGPFNLGMAFAAVQTASTGVYIAMNGSIFPARGTVKDRARGTFRSTLSTDLLDVECADATAR
jgi:L-asparaginase